MGGREDNELASLLQNQDAGNAGGLLSYLETPVVTTQPSDNSESSEEVRQPVNPVDEGMERIRDLVARHTDFLPGQWLLDFIHKHGSSGISSQHSIEGEGLSFIVDVTQDASGFFEKMKDLFRPECIQIGEDQHELSNGESFNVRDNAKQPKLLSLIGFLSDVFGVTDVSAFCAPKVNEPRDHQVSLKIKHGFGNGSPENHTLKLTFACAPKK